MLKSHNQHFESYKQHSNEPGISFATIAAAILFFAVPIAAISLIALPSYAGAHANAQAGATTEVTTVVTVLGAKDATPPAVAKEDVNVTEGKTRLTVTGWEPVQSSSHAQLQLAILIDNGLRSVIVGQQLEDLANFINSLPKDTMVGVFYGENGSAESAAGSGAASFSTDHAAVAQGLRVSMGRVGGDSPSIYLSLGDLVDHWQPKTPGAAKSCSSAAALIISIKVPEDPYFDSTLDKVQTAGVVVHTVYDGTNRYGSTFRGDISQGKLVQITSDSGGEGFFSGNGAPVSITPYLNQLNQILANQYMLTFTTEASKREKGELRSIEIRLEERDLKVSYAKRVFVQGK